MMAEPHVYDALEPPMLDVDDLDAHEVSEQEAWALFERDAQALMGISGEEFLRRYDAGEYDTMPHDNSRESLNFWSMVFNMRLVRASVD